MSSEDVFKPKVWNVASVDETLEAEFIRSLPISPILCRVLLNRGITTISDVQKFLNPSMDDLHDPHLFPEMELAVARTRQAIDNGEKIMVHGDYDVDGITSTTLLIRVLRLLKADVSWYLPNRRNEGYDLGIPAVEVAKERGAGLIITVDCGTSAFDAVGYANKLGIDVIVTDHHEIGSEIAPAYVVVNPRKPGCTYPFLDLAGVGVAFKFGEALIREYGYDISAYRRKFCDLAAVGTVGDVVPLQGENRILVKFGMNEIPRSGKKGLRALLETSGLLGKEITSQMLAFNISPRLNAAGRLADASVALELLLTTDYQEAYQLAQVLESHNKERQTQQEKISREAFEQIVSRGIGETAKVFVLSSQDWHPGVIGIVASKVMDRYNRPAILVAINDSDLAGVGSARSIAEFDLLGALMQCRHLLERCGGHARAAGLSISRENIDQFDIAINSIADGLLTEADLLPKIDVDVEISLDTADFNLAKELELLEPFGHCNREPIFVSRNALVLQKTRMGSAGTHMRIKLSSGSGQPVECVAFGWGGSYEAFRVGGLIDLCYNIQINRFGGRETVQAVLRDVRHSEAVISEPFPRPDLA